MATIGTITEVSVEEHQVVKVESGTGRRRATVNFRGTSGATSDTIDLADYIRGISGIECLYGETVDEAAAATASTWSGTTITFASHTGSGRQTLKAVVYF